MKICITISLKHSMGRIWMMAKFYVIYAQVFVKYMINNEAYVLKGTGLNFLNGM